MFERWNCDLLKEVVKYVSLDMIDRFKEIHSQIDKLHEEGMTNKEISNYLNSRNIKTPTGKEYTRQLIGMYFYKSRKIDRRLKHSELKLTNIRFWIY